MTPLQIDLCVHYYGCVNDHPWLHSAAPIVEETFNLLVDLGLLVDTGATSLDPRYVATDRLRVFVDMLCATPLPEERWIDPRTKAIVG